MAGVGQSVPPMQWSHTHTQNTKHTQTHTHQDKHTQIHTHKTQRTARTHNMNTHTQTKYIHTKHTHTAHTHNTKTHTSHTHTHNTHTQHTTQYTFILYKSSIPVESRLQYYCALAWPQTCPDLSKTLLYTI